MAHCVIPIRVIKLGRKLEYLSMNETKNSGIDYIRTQNRAFKDLDVKMISNASLYNEIKDIVELFYNQQMPIKLTSDGKQSSGVFYVNVGALEKYYSDAQRETLQLFQKPPVIVKRADIKASYLHADVELKKDDGRVAHFKNHLAISSKIADITKAGNTPFSISGYLTEFLTCPKCSGIENTYLSGLSLRADISNEVDDQETQLEDYAQKIFEELKKQGFEKNPPLVI